MSFYRLWRDGWLETPKINAETEACFLALHERIQKLELAESKNTSYRDEVLKNAPSFDSDTVEKKLSMGGLGVAGEAGEVADLIKKILHHEVPLASVREKLILEMGDVYWYLEYLGATLGVTTSEILSANTKKLAARHPNGWTSKTQQEKRDET